MYISTYDILLILELIILEGVLSIDNALALAAIVKKRLSNPQEQKRALLWGIVGSYVFRTIIIFVGVYIIQNQWVKAIAGIYLLYLSITELFFSAPPKNKTISLTKIPLLSPLWTTIIYVELMDVMFSIDSIGVALALSQKIWVLVTGSIIGILIMRLAANKFINLISKFPVLIKTAFILVGLAGLNMILDVKNMGLFGFSLTIDKAIPEKIFLSIIIIITLSSVILNTLFPKYFKENKINT